MEKGTISSEGSENMNIDNLSQEEKQESQLIEWKWSWHEEYLKWLCGIKTL